MKKCFGLLSVVAVLVTVCCLSSTKKEHKQIKLDYSDRVRDINQKYLNDPATKIAELDKLRLETRDIHNELGAFLTALDLIF